MFDFMKTFSFLTPLGALLALLFSPTLAPAQFGSDQLNLETSVQRVTVESEQRETESRTYTTEYVAYQIEITNRTFSDLENLDIEYTVYKREDHHGARRSDMTLSSHPGRTKIESLRNLDKFTFQTDPVKLETSELKARWRYRDRAKRSISDGIAGLHMRILQDNQEVFSLTWPAGFSVPDEN